MKEASEILDPSWNRDADVLHVDQAVEHLKERFDTVQILVTRHDSETGNTYSTIRGCGNWWARVGQTRNWLNREEYIEKKDAVKKEP